MTGYTVHTGSSVKFSDGWDKIFAGTAKKTPQSATAIAKKTPSKKKASAKKRGSR
jgi:hypothetical protein